MPDLSCIFRKGRSAFRLAQVLLPAIIAIFGSSVVKAVTIVVPSGGDLQAALNTANCGDTIVLQAGGTYITSTLEQPFVAKAKGACTGTNADFITIQGSAFSSLPPSLKDLSPSQINSLQ